MGAWARAFDFKDISIFSLPLRLAPILDYYTKLHKEITLNQLNCLSLPFALSCIFRISWPISATAEKVVSLKRNLVLRIFCVIPWPETEGWCKASPTLLLHTQCDSRHFASQCPGLAENVEGAEVIVAAGSSCSCQGWGWCKEEMRGWRHKSVCKLTHTHRTAFQGLLFGVSIWVWDVTLR